MRRKTQQNPRLLRSQSYGTLTFGLATLLVSAMVNGQTKCRRIEGSQRTMDHETNIELLKEDLGRKRGGNEILKKGTEKHRQNLTYWTSCQ